MRIIHYTIRAKENTGIYLDEIRAEYQEICEPSTPTTQNPKPVYERAEIEKRLQEICPDGLFERVFLSESEFWAKINKVRPACTIDEDPNEYRPSWDNE